jgi:hypothetical protein
VCLEASRSAADISALSLRTTPTLRSSGKANSRQRQRPYKGGATLRNHCSRGLFELVENWLLDLEMEAFFIVKLAGQLKSQL